MLQGTLLSRYLDEALAALSGPFAQLVFLASVRDHYTGNYIYEGLASRSSPVEVHELLHRTHLKVFEDATSLPLVAYCKEIRSHVQSLGENEYRVVRLWLELKPYYDMIPEGCHVMERELFISQFQSALRILAQAPDWTGLLELVSSPLPRPVQQFPPHWAN